MTSNEKKICRQCKAYIPCKASKCMHCGSKQGIGFCGLLAVVIFALFWIIIVFSVSLNVVNDSKSNNMSNALQSDLKVIGNEWYLGGFGYIPIHTITLQNTSSSNSYKDIEITVYYHSNSGAQLGNANYTIYEVLPANTTKTFSDINMGFMNEQSANSSVVITSAILQ